MVCCNYGIATFCSGLHWSNIDIISIDIVEGVVKMFDRCFIKRTMVFCLLICQLHSSDHIVNEARWHTCKNSRLPETVQLRVRVGDHEECVLGVS